ncbi:hypothetical protein G4B88_014991 [Cannabis sativa]|uniref:Uncharacterized protein n=1 Tax=Cannabis sativa TaxID=3483 RepID=A0A7J6F025_CANSA|nr:hypothetical protein G4B88_014991 [Cannabis sativa]
MNRDHVRTGLAALGFDEGWTSVRLHLGLRLVLVYWFEIVLILTSLRRLQSWPNKDFPTLPKN